MEPQPITLRPVRADDLPTLEQWQNDFEMLSAYNMFGLKPTNRMARAFEEDGFLTQQHGRLLIEERGGLLVGDMDYRQVHYGPGWGNVAYAIGISLVVAARGKGYGTLAQRLCAEYLFATYPIMRVEASTDISNTREQRSLEKAGFTREGLARKAQWRGGEWHDLVLYSKLRGE
ncbi:GNAT family N-acetyltransferase [Chloroflexia bacterium SDU3-3]|nr:GNAT family N-acetyltransferase [Chloroflexia bacterium SDU3-3]